MLKSIQIKIILAFSIVGVVTIAAFGFVSIINLKELHSIVNQTSENIRNKWKHCKSNLPNKTDYRFVFNCFYIFNDISWKYCFKSNNNSNF